MDSTTLQGGATGLGTGSAGPALALTILWHPDVKRVGDRARLDGLAAGDSIRLSRTEPFFSPPRQTGGEPLGDEHVSRTPLTLVATEDDGVRLETGNSRTEVRHQRQSIRGSRHFSAAEVRRGVVLQLGRRIVLLLHLSPPLQDVLAVDGPSGSRELVGESEGLCRVLWEIDSVANSALPVFLRGESGTGKELVARAIHARSPRRKKAFVGINLGAITSTHESVELFGCEPNAYPGAPRRIGYFEQAHGGTLLLDEIGEASVDVQVALLRALETGEIRPLGARESRQVDVRVIAATDANLEAKIAAGTFRRPLLSRLSTYVIRIPPLRERRDDIGRLLLQFLREELMAIGEPNRLEPIDAGEPWLPASVVTRLAEHDWPLNVRQLKNAVRRFVLDNRGRDRAKMTDGVEEILAEPAPTTFPTDPPPGPIPFDEAAFPASLPGAMPAAPATLPPSKQKPKRKPREVTEEELGNALRHNRWNIAETARYLGITRPSVHLRMQTYGLRTAMDLASEEIESCYEKLAGDMTRMAERLEVSERALERRVKELGLGKKKT